ncbi:isopenicillin N synthase family oxygenase [Microbacterium sp. LRZ72]|uniref:isopenicillin N synthase family dioxygenase n=1 Tax=Microbacterium sp. LRZ72 TaxID=2942481 RepID=UPI0029BC28C5|nr:2-oxoglutarate and iron-dependent oxygenase domain-containing protein [Microbacterium sp. LRZ72]MDX2377665.1 isopenicillin N synthase family oxygenase [Microbacterium sp. LRZ72]
MSFSVPSIDITAYVQGGSAEAKQSVARLADAACRDVGFVQVHGHGIPDEVIAGLASAMDDFFVGKDLAEKSEYRTPPGINRGYAPPKSEATSLSLGVEPANKMNDFFEAFNIGLDRSYYPGADLPEGDYQDNLWPSDEFREPVERYFLQARQVALTLMEVFEDALGLPEGYFEARSRNATGTMRMNNYALTPGLAVSLDGDLRGMGEHTDYGVVTVLWADQVKGLQILGNDGAWYDVNPDDGALLVNLGDVTARLTNDHWMSTLHRVKPPVVNGTIERRRSVAYFHSFDWDAVVEPLPECVGEGESPLYEPITVHDHLHAKLQGSRAGVANTSAVRESTRVRASL